jgi:hypothetical protein
MAPWAVPTAEMAPWAAFVTGECRALDVEATVEQIVKTAMELFQQAHVVNNGYFFNCDPPHPHLSGRYNLEKLGKMFDKRFQEEIQRLRSSFDRRVNEIERGEGIYDEPIVNHKIHVQKPNQERIRNELLFGVAEVDQAFDLFKNPQMVLGHNHEQREDVKALLRHMETTLGDSWGMNPVDQVIERHIDEIVWEFVLFLLKSGRFADCLEYLTTVKRPAKATFPTFLLNYLDEQLPTLVFHEAQMSFERFR